MYFRNKCTVIVQVISEGLSTDIYGIELDEKLFSNCREELNIIVEESGVPPVKWNFLSGRIIRI